MSVEFNLSNLIFILIAAVSAFWALVKIINIQQERRQDERFKVLGETMKAVASALEKNATDTLRLEREIMQLKAELPVHYVRREDYVQAIATIMTKLDAMALRFENILLKGKPREH